MRGGLLGLDRALLFWEGRGEFWGGVCVSHTPVTGMCLCGEGGVLVCRWFRSKGLLQARQRSDQESYGESKYSSGWPYP